MRSDLVRSEADREAFKVPAQLMVGEASTVYIVLHSDNHTNYFLCMSRTVTALLLFYDSTP